MMQALPFSLSRLLCALSLAILIMGGLIAPGLAQQTIILVRHAEQTLTGSMMDGDPPLNEDGARRAQALASVLKDAGVRAIYVSQYARAQQTVEPLARGLGVKPEVVAKDDLSALTERLKAHDGQGAVLVVGHSDTIPALLKVWGHLQPVTIDKTEFNSLWFVVSRPDGSPFVSRLRL
jgi:broad specificity phosphatase PhoE